MTIWSDYDFTVREYKVADLKIDPSYQRRTDPRRCREIADHFDPDIFDPIKVAERPEGNFVVNGGHRFGAVKLLGLDTIPGFRYAPTDLKDEATLFVQINTAQKKLTPRDVHQGRVVAGEPAALDIEHALIASGLKLGSSVGCIGAIERIHARCGQAILRRALAVAKHGLPSSEKTIREQILSGVAYLMYAHPGLDDPRLADALLRNYASILGMIAGQGEMGSGSRGNRCADVLKRFYNHGLRSRRLPD